MIEGLQLINSTFDQLGPEMHLGKGETAAKTEVMFIPGANFYNSPAPENPSLPQEAQPSILPADDTTDNDNNHPTPPNQRTPKNRIMSTISQKEREKLYGNSPITQISANTSST